LKRQKAVFYCSQVRFCTKKHFACLHEAVSVKAGLLRAFTRAAVNLKRIKNYKVWQDGNQPKQLITNKFMQKKIDYLHNNPVEAEIVDEPEHYLYSSARDYAGTKGLLDIEFI